MENPLEVPPIHAKRHVPPMGLLFRGRGFAQRNGLPPWCLRTADLLSVVCQHRARGGHHTLGARLRTAITTRWLKQAGKSPGDLSLREGCGLPGFS